MRAGAKAPLLVLVVSVFEIAGLAEGSLFGGPTIDGDTYSYDGRGKVYDPAEAFSGKNNAFNRITLSNWDMSTVAILSIPTSVKNLTLLNCNLGTIPAEINALTSLEMLNLCGNHLTSVGADFSLNTKINTLNLTRNNISTFSATIETLQALDLSYNALGSVPTTVFSLKMLTTLYTNGNGFKIQSVSVKEFDFFAGLGEFHADFVQVSGCPDGGTLVNLKGARVCRLDSGEGKVTPVSPSSFTTPTNASAPSVPEPPRSSSKLPMIALGLLILLLTVACVFGWISVASRRRMARLRGMLHEETPLFFDSDKRTEYRHELEAGERLFPSNDPVLVTYRIDYDAIKLVKRIAQGAFGEVWLGRYRGNKVAVKRLKEQNASFEGSEDFVREVKLMAWLKHPKIVSFVGVAWTKLVDMMAVIEYMDSGDLRSLLDTRKKTWTWASPKLEYAQAIIDALVYLHSLSPVIIHRDLKSRNILVDSKNGAKLGDFGVSATKRNEDMTVGVGTTRWLAPELARGESRYTEAVDVYSFGVILAELDTHDIPFQNAGRREPMSDFAILQQVSTGKLRVQFSSACPPKLRALGEQCTAHDPATRPAAVTVAYALRQRDILADEAK